MYLPILPNKVSASQITTHVNLHGFVCTIPVGNKSTTGYTRRIRRDKFSELTKGHHVGLLIEACHTLSCRLHHLSIETPAVHIHKSQTTYIYYTFTVYNLCHAHARGSAKVMEKEWWCQKEVKLELQVFSNNSFALEPDRSWPQVKAVCWKVELAARSTVKTPGKQTVEQLKPREKPLLNLICWKSVF